MEFDEWYEKNKESFSFCDKQEAMKQAWDAAYFVATEEMYAIVLENLSQTK